MYGVTGVAVQQWRVVVIEDNPEDRAELRRLVLEGSDRRYTLTEAATGAAGVRAVLAESGLPDCVLLDYNLPDMDALAVLDALAAPDGFPVCPVVVVTVGAMQDAGRALLRAGAQDFIGKSWVTAAGLARVMESAVERWKMGRELRDHAAALRGAVALDAAAEFVPHLVFLDIGLPDIDGYDVARKIRADPLLAATRLVALTCWGTEADQRKAKAAGFDAHLTKPVESSALDEVLARFTSTSAG